MPASRTIVIENVQYELTYMTISMQGREYVLTKLGETEHITSLWEVDAQDWPFGAYWLLGPKSKYHYATAHDAVRAYLLGQTP